MALPPSLCHAPEVEISVLMNSLAVQVMSQDEELGPPDLVRFRYYKMPWLTAEGYCVWVCSES